MSTKSELIRCTKTTNSVSRCRNCVERCATEEEKEEGHFELEDVTKLVIFHDIAVSIQI